MWFYKKAKLCVYDKATVIQNIQMLLKNSLLKAVSDKNIINSVKISDKNICIVDEL